MRPPIVRGNDLDVLDGAPAVAVVVLDPSIRELDVSVVAGQLAFPRPTRNGIVVPFRDSAAVPTPSVVPLKKPLILGLELLLEDHTTNASPALGELLRFSDIRRMDPGIVRELAGLAHAGVERLTWLAGSSCATPAASCCTSTASLRPTMPCSMTCGRT